MGFDWHNFLEKWNDLLISQSNLQSFCTEELIASDMIDPKILQSRWLGYTGATNESITSLEEKLGLSLPPSYREFLKVTNGFRQPTNLVPKIYSTNEVEWFSSKHQEVIDIWLEDEENILIDEPDFFAQYLPHTIQISAEEWGGDAVYLLNPKIISEDGEWEAFYFASWIPGANRYSSFWELMQKEYKQVIYNIESG
jgi:hypothetical protein